MQNGKECKGIKTKNIFFGGIERERRTGYRWKIGENGWNGECGDWRSPRRRLGSCGVILLFDKDAKSNENTFSQLKGVVREWNMRTYAPNGTKNVASGENRDAGSRTAYMDGWAESGWGFSLHSMRVYSRFLSQYLNYYFRKRAICATRFLRIRFILFSPTYFSHPANVFCVFAYECGSTTMEISIFFSAIRSCLLCGYVLKNQL